MYGILRNGPFPRHLKSGYMLKVLFLGVQRAYNHGTSPGYVDCMLKTTPL